MLDWFARDWDLSITEDSEQDQTIVTVLNPEEFPLSPHVCEEILLKLSRFTRWRNNEKKKKEKEKEIDG